MRIVTDLVALQRGRPTVLTIGAFDGVHRGHQFLIRQVVERARALDFDAIVLTFDPVPRVVLRTGSMQLMDGQEKARIIGAIGPDVLVVSPFTRELAEVPAGQFLGTIIEHVNLAELWIGADFAFGHNREGNVDFLIRSGQRLCFAVHVVPRQNLRDIAISSSKIRELIMAGDVERAALFLGHYFSLGGEVVPGFGRGSAMGVPTANVHPPPSQLLPATGIYAGYLRIDRRQLAAAISVGYNVVFEGREIVVEAHALDFSGDVRGRRVTLDLVARVREERNFDSVEALVAEMRRDIEKVRHLLSTSEEPGELLLQP